MPKLKIVARTRSNYSKASIKKGTYMEKQAIFRADKARHNRQTIRQNYFMIDSHW